MLRRFFKMQDHAMGFRSISLVAIALLTPSVTPIRADVGDPQIRTDHPWYQGELSCSTFARLFATQAELYKRVVGVKPVSGEQKALASWLWRNTHYWHGEQGSEDLWGKGFEQGPDLRTRDYWTGLFAHGFGLCGTTHSQWAAEMEALFGHGRGRCVGVDGHNSFEVFLQGSPYDAGKWVLLDHDISTVIFNREGTALLSIAEVRNDWKRLTDRGFAPGRQHGWLVCGLAESDGGAYQQYNAAEYLAGYAGVPPLVHLRRGETLRRYLRPGLEDEKTFVFWGRNYRTAGIPGPERSQTWVNQPEKMYRSAAGTGHRPGQARYANAVYTYTPDFTNGDWREGVIEADDQHVIFEFYTPYIIAATPASDRPWGVYEAGCRNGLVLHGRARCALSLSTDQGKSWQDCGSFKDGLDLTDQVKGRRQYWLRLHAGAKELTGSGLKMITVCQANSSTMPRLKEHGSQVVFSASGQAVISAGPNLRQAEAHLVAGRFGTSDVTMEIASPRQEKARTVFAAGHVLSGSPPQPQVKYQVDVSEDRGRTWKPMVKDWSIPRRGEEPNDFWSQSFCWGWLDLEHAGPGPVQVRFRNDGRKAYARCEVHLVYDTAGSDGTKVTFAWSDDNGSHQEAHRFENGQPGRQSLPWKVATSRDVETQWVEFEPIASREK
jgi:hypothetical protein